MRNEGFSFVEVLVAMVVLGVGLLALARMSVVNVQANVRSQDLGDGALLAEQKMEQLRQCATSGNDTRFGFDYLTSKAFDGGGSVKEPPPPALGGVDKTVPGLLSGSSSPAGVLWTSVAGTKYEVLYNDGTHGDATAGPPDETYTNQDTVTTATGVPVTRTWSVTRLMIKPDDTTDWAKLAVKASWTDRFGPRSVSYESLVHRRK